MKTSGNLFRCLRNSLQAGVVFGIIIIFLVLIGFDETAAQLIGKFLGNQGEATSSAMILNLVILLGLLGLWTGAYAAKPVGKDSWSGVLIAGSGAGLISGLMVAVLAFILGTLNTAQVGLRVYLAELSPDAIRLFLFGLSPLPGALAHVVLLLLTAVLGSIGARGIGRGAWRTRIGENWAQWAKPLSESALMKQIRTHPIMRYVIYGLILLILIGMPQILGQYWNYTVGTVGIYVLLGLGLNIVVGMAGLLDLGYVAFFAIGAYTMALLTSPEPHHLVWGFWVALPLGVLLAALSGLILGIPVLRLRGDYLAIVTLGFGEIIRILSKSDLFTPLTAGPRGVRNVAGPTLFGRPFNNDIAFVYLIILAILLVIFVTIRLENSRAGRAWIAMREDEIVAQAQGINTLRAKLLAFAIGAAFAGLGGALFASRNQFTGPEDHTLMVSINVLCLIIVGGMGSIPGVIAGAFVLKGLPEVLRELENYRILAFGALLVVMMIIRPEGLIPSRRRHLEISRGEDSLDHPEAGVPEHVPEPVQPDPGESRTP